MAERKKQRLFFALWPEPDQRQELLDRLALLDECPGRRMEAGNLHLTLAFLGNVNAETRTCLEEAATAIRLPPFTITLNHFGYWQQPRVVWLGTSDVPAGLAYLVGALEETMRNCGLKPESRPYRPHVTLLRKARGKPGVEDVPEMNWRAEGFALVLSESTPQGVRYRVLRQWDLTL